MKIEHRTSIEGLAGTADLFIPTATEPTDPPGWEATLVLWRFFCPGQAIAWDRFRLSVVHLRPLPNVEAAAHLRFPEATHEFQLMALDPAFAQGDDPAEWRFLTPFNYVGQVQVPTDEAAVEIARLAAQAVVDGRLWAEPPLSGQIEPWESTLAATAAHARGEHDESPPPEG